MSKTAPKVDPAVPFVSIEIGGEVYRMTVTHRALAVAEDELLRRGHDVNLLEAKLRPSLSGISVQFAASLLHYQPNLDFDEAQDMVTDDNLVDIVLALRGVEKKTAPEPDPSDPPQPVSGSEP